MTKFNGNTDIQEVLKDIDFYSYDKDIAGAYDKLNDLKAKKYDVEVELKEVNKSIFDKKNINEPDIDLLLKGESLSEHSLSSLEERQSKLTRERELFLRSYLTSRETTTE